MNSSEQTSPVLQPDLSPDAERLAERSLRLATDEQLQRVSASRLVTVRHAVPHPIGRIGAMHLLWDLGPVLSRAADLLDTRDLLAARLQSTRWSINTCVAMSAPATPLATLVATGEHVVDPRTARVHYLDNYSGRLSTDQFEPDQRIVLVDTLVRTGLHLATAYDYIQARGGQIAGVLTICLAASEPSDINEMHPLVADLIARNEIEYVYSWGQLLRYATKPEVAAKLAAAKHSS